MAFYESPKIEGGQIVSRSSLGGWIKKNRRWLLVLIAILLVVDGFVVSYASNPAAYQAEPGGMDGCLLTPDGQPASGIVHVDDLSRPIYLDGCFFFPSLSAGQHQFSVETSDGIFLTRNVQILPGEAIGLGTLTLP